MAIGRPFEPTPQLWRFHALYLLVTLAMAWSYYPFPTWRSLLLMASACLAGLLLTRWGWQMAVHLLALSIGLGTPLAVVLGLVWWQTAVRR